MYQWYKKQSLALSAIGLFALIFFISWGAWSLTCKPDDGSAFASWIQAVGSIVAIFCAIWLYKKQADDLRNERESRVLSILAVSEAAKVYAEKLNREVFVTPEHWGNIYNLYHESVTASLLQALHGVPVHEIGSSEGVTAFLFQRHQLGLLDQLVNRFIENKKPEAMHEDQDTPNRCESRKQIHARNVTEMLDRISAQFDILKNSMHKK